MQNIKEFQQVQTMFLLQENLNSIVDPNWKDNSHDWLRAAWVECAELVDHVGYKWWKQHSFNLPQAQIECLDIIHFILSKYIEDQYLGLRLNAAQDFYQHFYLHPSPLSPSPLSTHSILLSTESFVLSLLQRDPSYLSLLASLCTHLNLSHDSIFKMYVSKNVLNLFRQHHGYKSGSYIKLWPSPLLPHSFLEDNVFLEMYLADPSTQQLFVDSPHLIFQYLYDKLQHDYPS